MSHSGWSRTELLTVLALGTLAAGLLLPALLLARESARRQQCGENLSRLGLALHAYQASFEVFPPAAQWQLDPFDIADFNSFWKAFQPGPGPDRTGANWVLLLLPSLGEETLAQRWAAEVPIFHPRNEALRTTELPLMTCPSDSFHRPDNAYWRRGDDLSESRFARGNYAMNLGPQRDRLPNSPLATPPENWDGYRATFDPQRETFQIWGTGVGGLNRSFRPGDFSRGASNIIAVEEIRAGIHPVDSRGVWALGQIGGSLTAGHGVYGDDGSPNHTFSRADDITGCEQLHDLLGPGRLAETGMTCCWYINVNRQATARSLHRGGVQTLRLDGSLRFVENGIDPVVWHTLHSRVGAPLEEY